MGRGRRTKQPSAKGVAPADAPAAAPAAAPAGKSSTLQPMPGLHCLHSCHALYAIAGHCADLWPVLCLHLQPAPPSLRSPPAPARLSLARSQLQAASAMLWVRLAPLLPTPIRAGATRLRRQRRPAKVSIHNTTLPLPAVWCCMWCHLHLSSHLHSSSHSLTPAFMPCALLCRAWSQHTVHSSGSRVAASSARGAATNSRVAAGWRDGGNKRQQGGRQTVDWCWQQG
jgi:hypothetical protein